MELTRRDPGRADRRARRRADAPGSRAREADRDDGEGDAADHRDPADLANRDRGLPFAGLHVAVLFIVMAYLAKRTTFGRHVYAVGGSAEAAPRRHRRRTHPHPGLHDLQRHGRGRRGHLRGRLSSVDLNAGGGTILLDAIAAAVIGGTSLYGGRGSVKGALLGAAVIATIANGIDLIGYSSPTRFIVTGLILLAAVTLDTVSRRRLAASGR
jgi:D-xylose transport system permease protein